MKIAIIDYKMGNLFSVQHACKKVGINPLITSDKKNILNSDGVILPGVGAFSKAMQNLNELNLVKPIKDYIKLCKPFLGICLGMQLLFDESEEFGNSSGLGIIDGKVLKFRSDDSESKIKVPQIGWNKIYKNKFYSKNPIDIMEGIDDGEYMYFVHSYYSKPFHDKDILTTTNYENINYCSAIMRDNIIATQFHPEKSSKKGIVFYKNWAKLVKERS